MLRAGVYLVPFLPLYVSTSLLFPYVTGRNFAFRIVVELLLVGVVALWWRSPAHRPSRSPLTIALLVFVAAVAIADVAGINPSRSIWSTYQRMDGLLRVIHVVACYFILTTVLETAQDWKRYFAISVGVSALVAVLIVVQYVVTRSAGALVPPSGPVGNAGIAGSYLAMHVFACVLLLAQPPAPVTRPVLIAIIILQAAAVYVTGSRTALLALAVVGPATFATWRGWESVRVMAASWRWRLGVALVGAVAVAVVAAWGIPLAERFVRGSGSGGRNVRLIVWELALDAVRERPWVGWGQDNFSVAFDRRYVYAGEPAYDRAHSAFLDWLVAGGLLVLAAYAAVLTAFAARIVTVARTERHVAVATAGGLAAYLIFNVFWFDTLETQIAIVAWMAFVERFARTAEAPAGERATPAPWSMTGVAVTASAAVVVVAAVYFLNVRPVLAARDVIRGLTAWTVERRLADSAAAFKRAFDTSGPYRGEVAEAMGSIVPGVVASAGANDLARTREFASRAIRELQAAASGPDAESPRLRLLAIAAGSASVLDRSYRTVALDSFARALTLSPRNEQTYMAMANFYAADGDITTAMAMQRKAIAAAPDRAGLDVDLVRLAFRGGVATDDDVATARRYLKTQTAPVSIAVQYVRNGDFEMARLALDEALRRDPANLELLQQRDAIVRRLQDRSPRQRTSVEP